MIVYHGSNVTVQKPRIITSEIGRDFGFGFYTTEIKDQAIRWAHRKALIAAKTGVPSIAVLNEFEFDYDQSCIALKVMKFETPSLAWLDMILHCRTDAQYRHNYDIVIGKIADDNVGETVSFVMNGIMRKEDAIERLKFQKINNQVCFNTEESLQYLRFVGSAQV